MSIQSAARDLPHEPQTKVAAAEGDVDRHIFENRIRPRITVEIIDEHRADPFGASHSPDLEMVLRYLRRNPVRSKPRYLLVETQPFREWRLALYDRQRGVGPTVTDCSFGTRGEAQHAIFVRRLLDLDDDNVTRTVRQAESKEPKQDA